MPDPGILREEAENEACVPMEKVLEVPSELKRTVDASYTQCFVLRAKLCGTSVALGSTSGLGTDVVTFTRIISSSIDHEKFLSVRGLLDGVAVLRVVRVELSDHSDSSSDGAAVTERILR